MASSVFVQILSTSNHWSEFELDDSYQEFLQNMWTTVYVPDSSLKPRQCNLTEKLLQNSNGVKVFGIDKPMPSHIVTLQGGGKQVFHNFLQSHGYEIVKRFTHSSIFIFSKNSDMQYYIYRRKFLANE